MAERAGGVRILVVGDLVVDVVVAPGQPVTVDSDTPARVALRGGGSGANTAAWMARAGGDVAVVARVGDDLAGRLLAGDLAAAGVEPLLAAGPGEHTGAIVVMVEPDGRRTMLTDRGASARLAPGDLPRERFTAPGHLHLSGYTLLGEDSRAAGLAALRLAADAGMTMSVTPGTAAPLRTAGPAAFAEWTAGVTCCVANREEAATLLGTPAERDGDVLARGLAARYPEAVVTLGGAGAVWAGGGRTVRLPAAGGDVVDTTGAGDALAAGLLTAWLGGAPRGDALRRGLELAAEAVGAPGGRPGAGR